MSGRKLVRWGAATLLMCLAVSGCGGTDTETPAQEESDLQLNVLGILSLGESLEGVNRLTSATREAAEAIGWDVRLVDAQGDPSKAATGMRSLVQQGVDAIVDAAVEPSIIAQGLTEAREAGIPVVGLSLGSAPEGIVADFAHDDQGNTALIDDELARLVPRGSDVAATRFLGLQATEKRYEQFRLDAEKYGWNVVAVHDLTPPDFGTDAQTWTQSMLTANPGVAGVWTGSDPAAAGVARGIAAVRSDAIVVGFNGDMDALAAIRSGGPFKATVAAGLEEGAWGAVDVLLQVLAGEPVESGQQIGLPGAIVTEENVPAEGEGYFNVSGEDYVKKYTALWKQKYNLG